MTSVTEISFAIMAILLLQTSARILFQVQDEFKYCNPDEKLEVVLDTSGMEIIDDGRKHIFQWIVEIVARRRFSMADNFTLWKISSGANGWSKFLM